LIHYTLGNEARVIEGKFGNDHFELGGLNPGILCYSSRKRSRGFELSEVTDCSWFHKVSPTDGSDFLLPRSL